MCIRDRQLIRERITTDRPAEIIPDGLPEWIAPVQSIAQWDTPALFRQELAERRAEMVPEFNRLGSELAADPPAWAEALGPVPSDPEKQEDWRRLAAEISVYRDTYRIPVTEPRAIPADHRQKDLGAELESRITAMHKYTQQTSREPLSADDANLMHEAAEVEARMAEEQAPAEQVIDHLRTERAQESTLTPEQARAERVAELARRLKASPKPVDGQQPARRPEAVQEALAALKKRRATDNPEQEPTSKAAENLRKLRSHKELIERDDKNRRDLDQGPSHGKAQGPRYGR